jgi:hypothetical protein
MVYRIRLSHDGHLMTEFRSYGSSWCECGAERLREPLRGIVRDFLISRNDFRIYFLREEEIVPLLNRCSGHILPVR